VQRQLQLPQGELEVACDAAVATPGWLQAPFSSGWKDAADEAIRYINCPCTDRWHGQGMYGSQSHERDTCCGLVAHSSSAPSHPSAILS
jgi:hypothetical protein